GLEFASWWLVGQWFGKSQCRFQERPRLCWGGRRGGLDPGGDCGDELPQELLRIGVVGVELDGDDRVPLATWRDQQRRVEAGDWGVGGTVVFEECQVVAYEPDEAVFGELRPRDEDRGGQQAPWGPGQNLVGSVSGSVVGAQ